MLAETTQTDMAKSLVESLKPRLAERTEETFKSNIIAYYKHRTRHIGSLHGDTNALQQHTCTQQQMEKGEGAIEKKPHRIKNPTM